MKMIQNYVHHFQDRKVKQKKILTDKSEKLYKKMNNLEEIGNNQKQCLMKVNSVSKDCNSESSISLEQKKPCKTI